MNYSFLSSSPPSLLFHNNHHQHTDDEVPTLYQTLTERKKFNQFFEFCKHERCHENLLFWKLVQKYKTAKTREHQLRIMERIFERFILEESEYEINLNIVTKTTLYSLLVVEADNPSQTIFDNAQHEVYVLIESDPWLRYKKFLIEYN